METIRLLQSIDLPATNLASDGGTTSIRPIPTNIAIVLAVSLLSIALLISAIVIVAITLYPTNDDDDIDDELVTNGRSRHVDNDDDELVFVAEADAYDCKGLTNDVNQHDFHPFAKIINNNNINNFDHILHYY